MIAQFYNKFDELHEQSLTQALARSPHKVTMKNEVKYRIPDRWTKKFHKEDILGIDPGKLSKNIDQVGLVNKESIIQQRNELQKQQQEQMVR